jgi:hypothetical protein
MSKSRNIADLGSNDVIETSATGVDVTGTVTADGLTVGNSSANADLVLSEGSTNTEARIRNTNGILEIDADLNNEFGNSSMVFAVDGTDKVKINNNGDVSFYEDTGTTAKFVWDASAENLSINSNGAFPLSLDSDSGETILKLDNSSTNGRRYWLISGGTSGSFSGGKWGVYDADAGAERLTIDSAGNVGIGTASPQDTLHVASADAVLRLETTSTTGQAGVQFWDAQGGTNKQAEIRYSDSSNVFTIQGNANGTVFLTPSNTFPNASEAARIDSSGNLLVGTTAASAKWLAGNGVDRGIEVRGDAVVVSHTSYENQLLNTDNITAHIRFYYRGSATGSINTSGSGTVYATTSDYRLKENVSAMYNASDRVKALKPCRFNFIAAPDSTVDGFLAHEAQEVVPEAVTGTKDAMDEDGNPEYQGIDQSKLVPLLTKALQEAITKIEQLETRIETLENN